MVVVLGSGVLRLRCFGTGAAGGFGALGFGEQLEKVAGLAEVGNGEVLFLLFLAAGLEYIPIEAVLLAEAAEAVEGVEVAAFEGVEFEDDLGGEVDLFFAEVEVGEVGKGGQGVGEEGIGEFEVAAEVPPGVEVGEGGEGGLEAEFFQGETAGALEAKGAVKPRDDRGLLLRGQGLEFGVASGFSLYVVHAGREHGAEGKGEEVLYCLHSLYCGFLGE
jgi:hypothetical protein